MIDTQIVADYLTNFFNDNHENITFYFYAEVGKSEYKANVTGMVTTESSKLPPVNLKNGLYTFYVGLIFGVSLSNNFFIKVKKIVEDKLSALNGTTIQIGNGKGFVIVTLPSTGDFKIDRGVGSSVPMTITMTINYTEDNVLLPKSKHWLLDGKEINYISESLSVNKNGKINPINSRNYNQTLLMSQTRYYHFKLYNDTSDLCSMLQKDLLDGELNKTYTLTYFDGKNFTEANPFETKVLIYNSGNSLTEVPNTPMFDLTFIDADDGKNEVKYQMALIDNSFDAQTENVRWFASQDEQINYYLEKIALGADFDDIPAPNINSLYLTSQIYLNTRKYDIFDLINKNYAIIKATKGEIINYFYYRVLKGEIGANGQVIYDLKLDSIQTYLFNPNLEIKGTFINKAHLDRWIDNGDGTISFNGKADSKLFEREEIRNVAKRLVARERLKYYTEEDSLKNLYEFLNENVVCWCYVSLSTGNYTFTNATKQVVLNENKTGNWYQINNNINASTIGYSISTIVFPIMRDNKNIIVFVNDNNVSFVWHSLAFQEFLEKNEGFSSIKSIKLSIKPPFYLRTQNSSGEYVLPKYNIKQFSTQKQLQLYYFYDEDNPQSTGHIPSYLTDGTTKIMANQVEIIRTKEVTLFGLMIQNFDPPEDILFTTNLQLPQITFNKDDIVDNAKNKIYNPKLNNSDYKNLSISFIGSTFDLDIQKLNLSQVILKFIEMETPDVTKFIVRLKTENTGNIFNEAYSNSYNGFSITNDLSIPISNSQLNLYLANNKNAYLSFQNQQNYNRESANINMITSGLSGIIGVAGNIATGNFTGAITGAASTITGASNTVLQTDLQESYRQTQFDLTIDNMRNAPNSLQNANGNAIFANAVSEFGIYAELYEGLDTELESANDIMFRDGYNLNRFGEIQDYIHIRKYFNYIKAVLGNISGVPISEEARIDLRQRFADGVRFWTTDDIDYTKENYELSLEE